MKTGIYSLLFHVNLIKTKILTLCSNGEEEQLKGGNEDSEVFALSDRDRTAAQSERMKRTPADSPSRSSQ